MHGRLKVRTSVELQAIQKKKDQEKANVYEAKMKDIFRKRVNAEYDDEIMSLTSEIIYMNPDVATVWNVRKERLQNLKKNVTYGEVVFGKRKFGHLASLNAYFDICKMPQYRGVAVSHEQIEVELKLTEAGLRINPKSYCAWHHRCWILDNFASQAEWAKELQICTKYLELDDRNFHCWDYRRYILERHETQLSKELDFSLKKLESNFSNYSAWHYRSKLIPRVHTTFKRKTLFENNNFQNEISLVENAVYTDPKDQSAWFYHRWLLGHIDKSSVFVQAGYDVDTETAWVVVHPLHSSMNVQGLGDSPWNHLNGNACSNILVKSVDRKRFENVNSLGSKYDVKIVDTAPLLSGKNFLESASFESRSTEGECSNIIRDEFLSSYFGNIILTIRNEVVDRITLQPGENFVKRASFKPALNAQEERSLREQLKSYEKLLELAPDSKWCLLAVLVIKEKLGENVESFMLEKLLVNDSYRRNYYSDLASRYKMEYILCTIEDWRGSFVLKNQNLTAFYHSYFFTLFKEVDLSGNPLGNGVIAKLEALLSCKVLNLSNCKITSIDVFPTLPKLQTLNISQNEIICDKLPPALLKCPLLEVIDLTTVRLNSNIRDITAKELPNLILKN